MAIITLTTDFGTRDHYVAAMKGVMLQIDPRATIVDVTHEIEPRHVLSAAFLLRQVWPWFPPGTVNVAVVDPGVGTTRRILAGRYNDRLFIAPDNGLLSLVHRAGHLQELRVVENRRYMAATISSTFHGRDILAPVAAHVGRGVRLADLGPPTDHLEVLELPEPKSGRDGALHGQVLYVDRFGNLISNISGSDLSRLFNRPDIPEAFIGDRSVGPLRVAYGDVPAGTPLALIGSTGMLEIAVNQGNAARDLAASAGDPLSVKKRG